MRRTRAHLALAAGMLAAATLAACSSGSSTQTSSADQRPEGLTSTSASGSSSPSPSAGDAGGPQTPATTAGDLDAHTVPKAPDLGAGWKRYVDPGQAEEGYVGNGSWVRARNVDDVIAGIVPLGCLDLTAPPKLPMPRYALEATYRGPGGAPGVALALEYGSGDKAGSLVDGMAKIARSCPAPAKPVGRDDPLTVVVTPEQVDTTTVLDRRREYGADATPWLWSEAVVRSGSRVGLLIVATDPAAAKPDLARLARSLRAAVAR